MWNKYRHQVNKLPIWWRPCQHIFTVLFSASSLLVCVNTLTTSRTVLKAGWNTNHLDPLEQIARHHTPKHIIPLQLHDHHDSKAELCESDKHSSTLIKGATSFALSSDRVQTWHGSMSEMTWCTNKAQRCTRLPLASSPRWFAVYRYVVMTFRGQSLN